MNARCVWGRADAAVREIGLGSRSETRAEIASDALIHVADGELSLVEVQPDLYGRAAGRAGSADYRFGFRFAGGL